MPCSRRMSPHRSSKNPATDLYGSPSARWRNCCFRSRANGGPECQREANFERSRDPRNLRTEENHNHEASLFAAVFDTADRGDDISSIVDPTFYPAAEWWTESDSVHAT